MARYSGARIRSEYPVNVSEQLRGSLDYLLLSDTGFLVVEAKNADMERGYAQLTAEIAALDKWTKSTNRYLYGAVSVGSFWQFGVLDRQNKSITQDANLYVVPQGLHELLAVLVAVVRGEGEPAAGGEG